MTENIDRHPISGCGFSCYRYSFRGPANSLHGVEETKEIGALVNVYALADSDYVSGRIWKQ